MIIFIVDKVERYDGQNKHQGRLRLSTMISLVHAISESWVTVPGILAKSDEVHVFNLCPLGYILCTQILYEVFKFIVILESWVRVPEILAESD